MNNKQISLLWCESKLMKYSCLAVDRRARAHTHTHTHTHAHAHTHTHIYIYITHAEWWHWPTGSGSNSRQGIWKSSKLFKNLKQSAYIILSETEKTRETRTKHLMTPHNTLSRQPSWDQTIIKVPSLRNKFRKRLAKSEAAHGRYTYEWLG
jgi:hypothetical protein